MFSLADCTDPSPSNILEILEKHVATTCSVVDEQQNELRRLKALCTSLHKVKKRYDFVCAIFITIIETPCVSHSLALSYFIRIGFRKKLCGSKVAFASQPSVRNGIYGNPRISSNRENHVVGHDQRARKRSTFRPLRGNVVTS